MSDHKIAHHLANKANALWGEGWQAAMYRGKGTAARQNPKGEMEVVLMYYDELVAVPARKAGALLILENGGGT